MYVLYYTNNICLTFSTLGKTFSSRHFKIFQTTGFDIPCKLSPSETICMKFENLFSEIKKKKKNKKNIINLSSAEFAQIVVKVKQCPVFLENNIFYTIC